MQELLMAAIELGEIDVAINFMKIMSSELLLDFDKAGSTVAHYFARHGQLRGLIWLRDNLPAALIKKNTPGHTPFTTAILLNSPEIVEFFSENKIDNFISEAHENAFYGRHLQLVDNSEEQEKSTDEAGYSPLVYAVASGKTKAAEYLLQRKPVEFIPQGVLFLLILENRHLHMLDLILARIDLHEAVLYLKEMASVQGKRTLLERIEHDYPAPGEFINDSILQRYQGSFSADDLACSYQILIYESLLHGCEKIALSLMRCLCHNHPLQRFTTIRFILEIGATLEQQGLENKNSAQKKDIIRLAARLCAENFNQNPLWFTELSVSYIRKNCYYLLDSVFYFMDEAAKKTLLNSPFKGKLLDALIGIVNGIEDFNSLLHMSVLYLKPDIALSLLMQGASTDIKSHSGLTVKKLIETKLSSNEQKLYLNFKDNNFSQKLKLNYQLYNRIIEKYKEGHPVSEAHFKLLRGAILFLISAGKKAYLKGVYFELLKTLSCLTQKKENTQEIKRLNNLFIELLDTCGLTTDFIEHIFSARLSFILQDYEQASKQIDCLFKIHARKKHFEFYPSSVAHFFISKISLILIQSFELSSPPELLETLHKLLYSETGSLYFGLPTLLFHPPGQLKKPDLTEAKKLISLMEASKIKFNGSDKQNTTNPGYKILLYQVKDDFAAFIKWLALLYNDVTASDLKGDERDHAKEAIYFKIRLLKLVDRAAKAVKNDAALIDLHIDFKEQIAEEILKAQHILNSIQQNIENEFLASETSRNLKIKSSDNGPKRKKPQRAPALKPLKKESDKAKREIKHNSIPQQPIHQQTVNLAALEEGEWQLISRKKSQVDKAEVTWPLHSRRKKNHTKTQLAKNKNSESTSIALPLKNPSLSLPSADPIMSQVPAAIVNFFDKFPPGSLWLVGGAVRDALLGLEPDDFDFVTSEPYDRLKETFADATMQGQGKNHSLQLVVQGFKCDIISLANNKMLPIEEHLKLDSKKRDFTMNAFYWRPRLSSEIVKNDGNCFKDFYNGKRHLLIERKLVEIPNDYEQFVFVTYPKRFLRAVRLVVKYKLTLSDYLLTYKNENIRSGIYNALFSLDASLFHQLYDHLKKTLPDERSALNALSQFHLLNYFKIRGVVQDTAKIKQALGFFKAEEAEPQEASHSSEKPGKVPTLRLGF